MRWLGHVERMSEGWMPKRMLRGVYSSEDGREDHVKMVGQCGDGLFVEGAKGWTGRVEDRVVWRRVAKEAKAHHGLHCRWWFEV
jgi:hypothetical protein